MRLTSVVLPLPRKPVTMVTGVLSSLLWLSFSALSDIRCLRFRSSHQARQFDKKKVTTSRAEMAELHLSATTTSSSPPHPASIFLM
eukprot:762666-Hanusia_phi.AAC.3